MAIVPTWIAPRDWATLEVLTSSNMDDYISNNLLHLKTKNVARYSTNAGQVIAATTISIVNYEDIYVDVETCVTVGAAWKYTAPYTAYYSVSAAIQFASSAGWANGEIAVLYIYKNNVVHSIIGYKDSIPTGATNYMQLNGSDVISLAATDFIDIRVYQGGIGPTHPLEANGAYNYVSIFRIN